MTDRLCGKCGHFESQHLKSPLMCATCADEMWDGAFHSFVARSFDQAFHDIQQRVEAARFKVLLAESQISTHEEIKPTIETWNQWAEMIQLHHELIKVYNDALNEWSDLYGGDYKILPLQINPAKCPKCHEPYGTVKNCVPGRCGDSLTPTTEALFEMLDDALSGEPE